MKKIGIGIAALLAGCCMPVEAIEGYNLVGISANQMHFNIEEDGDETDSGSFLGFGVNYLHGFRLTGKLPLYLETGGSMKFMFYSDHQTTYSGVTPDGDWIRSGEYRQRIQTVTLTVPVNVAYKWQINDKWAVVPYVGLDMKAHLSGWVTDITIDENGEFRDVGNLFSNGEDDMDGRKWRRFQLGWNVGVRAEYRRVFASVSYGTDLTRVMDRDGAHIDTQNIAVTFGYKF